MGARRLNLCLSNGTTDYKPQAFVAIFYGSSTFYFLLVNTIFKYRIERHAYPTTTES